MLKAVIFDMDGVIVDSEPIHHAAYQKTFNEFEIEVSPELYASFTGKATLPICEYICSSFNLKISPEILVACKRKYFSQLFDQDTSFKLLDGVLELIQEYHEKALTLVLASSASMVNINRIFKRFDLDPYFISKHSGADLKASKPHPEIFKNAAKASGFLPSECIVIEDALKGLSASKAAGMSCIIIRNQLNKNIDFSEADLIFSSLSDFLTTIKTLI